MPCTTPDDTIASEPADYHIMWALHFLDSHKQNADDMTDEELANKERQEASQARDRRRNSHARGRHFNRKVALGAGICSPYSPGADLTGDST